MRLFWMFVLVCLGMCSCVTTTKSGDVRLFDTKICVKGEQTVTKTDKFYYKVELNCTQYLNLCHLQRFDGEHWETLTTITTTCAKAPPLNLEGTAPFDLTKQMSVTAN